MEVAFDPNQFRRVQRELGALDKDFNIALSHAITRVSSAIKTQFARELALIAKVPAAQFAANRISIQRKGGFAMIWIGLNPISLAHLNARRQKDGVKVTPGFVEGAFFINKIGNAAAGANPVFINKKRAIPDGFVHADRHDLDNARKLEWTISERAEALAEKIAAAAGQQLLQRFEHELKHITGN